MSNDRLKVVDAFALDDELRALLRPGEMVRDEQGRRHRLPRYFYEIAAHEEATNLRLTPHFGMNEFVFVDLREDPRLQAFPRYIPGAYACWRSISNSSAPPPGPRCTSPSTAATVRRSTRWPWAPRRTCGGRPRISIASA